MKSNYVRAGRLLPAAFKAVRTNFFFFFVLACSGCAVTAQDGQTGLFYSIAGNGLKDTSYLFGTYHQLNDSYLDELPQVKKHFSEAKGVVVELVFDSAGTKAALDARTMENSLTSLFDRPFLDSLDAELKSNIGIGVEQANNMKPALIVLLLSIGYVRKHNQQLIDRYTGQQMDTWFGTAAKQTDKTVTTLETMEAQNSLMLGAGMEQQVSRLKRFLRNSQALHQLDDDMLQSWLRRDLDRMDESYQKFVRISGEEDKLIKARNPHWANKLPALLQQKSQFIAVGALHLPGRWGLIRLLQQKGYKVTPVSQ